MEILLLQAVPVDPGGLPGGYVWGLVRASLALATVLLLAWLLLRWLARRGVGTGGALLRQRQLRLVERLPLDARRSVYLVEAGRRAFLLGVGDGEAPRLITELASITDSVQDAPGREPEPSPELSLPDVPSSAAPSTDEERHEPSS